MAPIRSPWRWPPRLRPVSNWCRPNDITAPPLAPATMCVALLVSLHCRARQPHPPSERPLKHHTAAPHRAGTLLPCVACPFRGAWGEVYGEAVIETHATSWRTDHEREVTGKGEVAEGANKERQKTWKAVDKFKEAGAGVVGKQHWIAGRGKEQTPKKCVTQFRESAETGATKAA